MAHIQVVQGDTLPEEGGTLPVEEDNLLHLVEGTPLGVGGILHPLVEDMELVGDIPLELEDMLHLEGDTPVLVVDIADL